MKYNRATRRMFLQGAGKALMAVPFLPSLMPKAAWGQSPTVPKRFISLLCDHEVGHNSGWLPNTSGSVTNLVQPNRTLNPGGGHHAIRWQPLSEFVPNASTPLAPLYGTTLNAHLANINIMRGLDYAVRYGHGSGNALGALQTSEGFGGNLQQVATIDSVLANNRTINPNGRYVFGGAPGGFEGFSRNLSGNASTRISTFAALYNTLFDNGNLPESGGGTPQPQPPHPRRDLLSRVLEDYNRVINSRNISAVDKTALTNAMDKMSDVHRGLQQTTPTPVSAACSHRALARPGSDISDAPSFADRSKVLVDLITASILCDSNRIFTFGFYPPYNEYSGATPGADIVRGVTDWHQQVSHTPFGITNGTVNWQWVINQQRYLISRIFAPLVQNLAGAIDPSNNQSYLHNSLILASYESAQTHGWASHPVILAGRAGGAISSGNYIDYSDRAQGTVGGADNYSDTVGAANFSNNYWGVSYNRFLVTILQAMGMAPASYENNALNAQVYNRTDIGTANRNLTAIGGFNYAFRADVNSSSYMRDFFTGSLPHYNLTHFRNPLPMP